MHSASYCCCSCPIEKRVSSLELEMEVRKWTKTKTTHFYDAEGSKERREALRGEECGTVNKAWAEMKTMWNDQNGIQDGGRSLRTLTLLCGLGEKDLPPEAGGRRETRSWRTEHKCLGVSKVRG